MMAKVEKRRLELYQMDLIWLLAKKYYNGLPQPSEIEYEKHTKDTRSAKQIQQDILKRLGGGK